MSPSGEELAPAPSTVTVLPALPTAHGTATATATAYQIATATSTVPDRQKFGKRTKVAT